MKRFLRNFCTVNWSVVKDFKIQNSFIAFLKIYHITQTLSHSAIIAKLLLLTPSRRLVALEPLKTYLCHQQTTLIQNFCTQYKDHLYKSTWVRDVKEFIVLYRDRGKNRYKRSIIFSYLYFMVQLTPWGRVTQICVSTLNIIGSDNGVSPGRRQAIIWTNAGILLTNA